MRRRRYYSAFYNDNYIPDTLLRPVKDRPNWDRWSYLEKITFKDLIDEYRTQLEYIREHKQLPPDMDRKTARMLQQNKILSQKTFDGVKGWDTNKFIGSWF